MNINVLMINTLETSKIFKVCIEIVVVPSMFSQRVINDSSMKKQWNFNDSQNNTTITIKIKKASIEFINVSNISPQRVINESSTKQQGNINVSEITTTKGLSSLISASRSSRSHQRLFKESSTTINQCSCNELSKFDNQHNKNFCWSKTFASNYS